MYPALRTAAMAGGLGLAGAAGADWATHDGMDYTGETLKSIRSDLAALPPQAAQAVMGTVGRTADSGERELVMATLAGTPPDQVLATMPGAPSELRRLIKDAGALAAGAPQIAQQAIAIGMKMNGFEAEAQGRNLDPAAVSEAVNSGEAGTSPLPALLGGAGLGSGGAILQHLLNRMGAKTSEPAPAASGFRARRS
jgi:hypothetical protein